MVNQIQLLQQALEESKKKMLGDAAQFQIENLARAKQALALLRIRLTLHPVEYPVLANTPARPFEQDPNSGPTSLGLAYFNLPPNQQIALLCTNRCTILEYRTRSGVWNSERWTRGTYRKDSALTFRR